MSKVDKKAHLVNGQGLHHRRHKGNDADCVEQILWQVGRHKSKAMEESNEPKGHGTGEKCWIMHATHEKSVFFPHPKEVKIPPVSIARLPAKLFDELYGSLACG